MLSTVPWLAMSCDVWMPLENCSVSNLKFCNSSTNFKPQRDEIFLFLAMLIRLILLLTFSLWHAYPLMKKISYFSWMELDQLLNPLWIQLKLAKGLSPLTTWFVFSGMSKLTCVKFTVSTYLIVTALYKKHSKPNQKVGGGKSCSILRSKMFLPFYLFFFFFISTLTLVVGFFFFL